MPHLETVDPARARDALASVAPRLTKLIRSVGDPTGHAVGVWNAGDVAVHLVDAWETLTALSRGAIEPPLRNVGELAALTTAMVARQSDRDLDALAARIDAAAATFLAATAHATNADTSPWIVRGIEVPITVITCHLLNESLVHGDDIARAEGRRWPIERAHAALVLMGFLMPVLSRLDPRALVIKERAAGVHACYDVRLRGGGGVVVRIEDGGMLVEPPSSRRVDCHISADPVALLLLMFSRRGILDLSLRGRLLAWGRRPWLAPKLRTLVRNP